MYKFAIIGCGRIAQKHADNIQKSGKLVAVCDIDKEKRDAFAKQYGATAYDTIDDLLANEKEVDVISICTPNGYHAEHSIKSLQAGKHVLCEKPMCLTGAAAWQMLETEKFSRKKLFVVKSTRFNPIIKGLKKVIEEGKLGKIYSFQLNMFWNRPPAYYTDWHGKLFPDGGTLYTQFSHYIDTLIWLLGDVDTVQGFANAQQKKDIEFEDTGVVAVKMKNDALGTINWSVNTFQKNTEIGLTIIAENGTIAIGGAYLNELKYAQVPFEFVADTNNKEANNYKAYNGSMTHHAEVYQNLINSLQQSTSNAMDGLKTVETIEKIYKAVRP